MLQHTAGIFWDFSPTSIRPPLGLLQGNAGVEYSLAYAGACLGQSFRSVLEASLCYGETLFDTKAGNWPDYDATVQLRGLEPQDTERRVLKGDIKDLCNIREEDSISWGAGTVGILLARSIVAAAYHDSGVGTRALADVRRAVGRIVRNGDAELSKLDNSLLCGLPGVVAGLQACRRGLPRAESERLAPVTAAAGEKLALRPLDSHGDDVSLLTGISGHVLGLLAVLTPMPASSCIHPVGTRSLPGGIGDASENEAVRMLERRLPMAGSRLDLRAALRGKPVNLLQVRAATDEACRAEPDSPAAKAIRYQIGLYEELAGLRAMELFWKEAVKRSALARIDFTSAPDEAYLMCFRLSDSVQLMELDFDPEKGVASPNRVHLLRQQTSCGIVDAKLSSLEHGLLVGFGRGTIAWQAIRNVACKVEAAGVTQKQLTDYCRNLMVRFIQAGWLEHVPAPGALVWLRRVQFRRYRKRSGLI